MDTIRVGVRWPAVSVWETCGGAGRYCHGRPELIAVGAGGSVVVPEGGCIAQGYLPGVINTITITLLASSAVRSGDH